MSVMATRRRHLRARPTRPLAAAVVATALLTALTWGLAAQAKAQSQDLPGAYAWSTATWRLQLRTTAYAFQTAPLSGGELDRLGGYQEFDGAITNLANGHLALRVSGRVADDLYLTSRGTTAERLYTGHLQARLGRKLTARLGRQFVQEGPTGLTLDGAWVELRPKANVAVRVFGGARAPLSRIAEAGSLSDDPAFGARVGFKPIRQLDVATSLAYRERDGVIAERPLGLEAGVTPWRSLRAVGRIAYDLEGEHWVRAEAIGMWRPAASLPTFTVQTVDRRPAIDAGSYFARFSSSLERIRATRATMRHELPSGFGAEIEYLGTFVDEKTSTHLGGAVLFKHGRVGYAQRIGDAGESSRWYGYFGHRVLRWLQVDGGASLSTYALLENAPEAEERDLTTLFGRLTARLRDGLRLHAEVQGLDNPIYSEDVRLLLGLDLDIGRGASRFGLGDGGWLQ